MTKILTLLALISVAFAGDVYDANGYRLVQAVSANGEMVWVRADTSPSRPTIVHREPTQFIYVERPAPQPQVVYVERPTAVYEVSSGITQRDVVAAGIGVAAGLIIQKHHKKMGF